jgi:hypothetical protein
MAADDAEEKDRAEAALERRKASRQRTLGSALAARTAAQAAADAAAAAAALGKRPRKASTKVLAQAETVALLASPLGKVRRGIGMAAKASMRRRAALAAAGDHKMEGLEARRGSNPAYQPMALLPGEQPLGVELFFGEGRPLQAGRKLGPPTPGALLAAGAAVQPAPLQRCLPACLPGSAA